MHVSVLRRIRNLRHTGFRLGWGVLDQAVSSLANFLLGVFVARTWGATDLGALAMVLLVYGIALNVSRALSTDTLMVRFSGATGETWRGAVAAATGMALVVGLVMGALCASIGVVILLSSAQTSLGWCLIALAATLPGLMLQDSWRYAFFSVGRGAKAFTNDAVWTALLVVALLTLGAVHVPNVAWAVLALGVTGSLAAVLGVVQAGVSPRCRDALRWLLVHRDLGARFLIENVTLGVGGQIRSLVVALTGGLAAAGAIRGAEMVVAPVVTILMGAAQVAVPEMVAARQRGLIPLRNLCRLLSFGLAAFALLWGVALMVALPLGVGDLLLGKVSAAAVALVPGVVVGSAVGCLFVGPSAGLRALERADKTMRSQLVTSFFAIGTCAVGGVLWGAQGAVWGKAAGAGIGAWMWWSQWASVRRQLAHRSTEVVHPPEKVPAAPLQHAEATEMASE